MKRFYIILSLLLIVVAAGAYSGWNSRIPNGEVNGCYNCHNIYPNQFYYDFRDVGGYQWNATLAAMDSDGDSYTNGEELLDPNGTWSEGDADPGDPAYVTNPNDVNDYPTDIESSSLGEVKASFK